MSEQTTTEAESIDGAASLLDDVLGVGSARMHPHENKFHAGNGGDGKHYWLTPPDLYAQLDAEFHFDFDPCPYPKPADFDGLTCEWGQRNYVNPPFGSIIHQGRKKGPTAWMRKAIEEQRKGKLSVVVYPVDKWVLMMLAATGAQNVRNLGDVKWCATEDGSTGKGTGRHIACFILTPNAKAVGLDAAGGQSHTSDGFDNTAEVSVCSILREWWRLKLES